MNTIVQRQNSPAMLKLMRARRRVYKNAELWQNLQIIIMVATPAAGALVGLFVIAARPIVAVVALGATLLDVWLMDPRQKESNHVAARIAEEFDCSVLQLPWNEFVAGRRLDPEEIERWSNAYEGDEVELHDWYEPPELALADLSSARIICQLQNLWYNADLRQRGIKVLGAIAGTLIIAVVAVGVAANLSLTDLTVSVAAPAAPILIWALRERARQREAADAIEQVKGAADRVWKTVSGGAPADGRESARRAREVQDGIYLRRSSSALPFPRLYGMLRPAMERSMKAGAVDRLSQVGVRVPSAAD